MTRVVHLTPHLGGGVGRALSNLVGPATRMQAGIEHEIICLEHPQKSNFLSSIEQAGVRVAVAPDASQIAAAIERADVVQVEFWNHPAIMRALCGTSLPPMRLVVWCHVSGLHWPRIPADFMASAQRFLFTAPSSLSGPEALALGFEERSKLGVVSSAAGLEAMPVPPARPPHGQLRFGYLGSLNFAKLHPDFVELLGGATDRSVQVRMIGDVVNAAALERKCREVGRPELLQFRGYVTDVATELSQLDVLLYLLNPFHYGTAEYSLLEAMAMQVVPVVWNNRPECDIVEHGRTGVVVSCRDELRTAVRRLSCDPQWRLALGAAASEHVRATYTHQRLGTEFATVYRDAMHSQKAAIGFDRCFGRTPADWFLSFSLDRSMYCPNGNVHLPNGDLRYVMVEPTKGSVFHFESHFPDAPLLSAWAGHLRRQAAMTV